jgi:hypothetical protein
MRASTILAVVGAIVPIASAASSNPLAKFRKTHTYGVSRDECDDTDSYCDAEYEYLDEMCFPDIYGLEYDDDDDTDSVLNPTAPCEIFSNIYSYCAANGTEEIDFIAEQECMCTGGFFDAYLGCNECFRVHGGTENAEWFPTSVISSASAAFCTATPTDSFEDILGTAVENLPYLTATGTDLYPNKTDVSLYFTATGTLTAGAITGSATAATYDWDETYTDSGYGDEGSTSITDGLAAGESGINRASESVTKTTTPPILGGVSSTSSSTSGASGSGSATGSAATASSTGAATELKAMGGLLGIVVLGAGLVL